MNTDQDDANRMGRSVVQPRRDWNPPHLRTAKTDVGTGLTFNPSEIITILGPSS